MKPHILLSSVTLVCIFHVQTALGQDAISAIARTWKIDKSSISGIMMNMPEEEQSDYLDLNTDNTFVRVDEGKCFVGKWSLDKKTNKIQLVYEHNKQEEFFSIKKIDKNQLVLKLEEDWKNEMVMYLSAVKYPCSI